MRFCERCGEPIPRKTYRPHQYAVRRFCSHACANSSLFSRPLAERFWEKVQKTEGCWLWLSARTEKGYGQIGVDGRVEIASRVSWFLFRGEWPNRFVLHSCDNPPCVRPEHLFLGDVQSNAADMVAKGRSLTGDRSPHARLASALVVEDRALVASGASIRSRAKARGVSYATMWNAVHGVTWKES